MDEPKFDVLSKGLYRRTAVSKSEAWEYARAYSEISGHIVSVFEAGAPKPGVLAMPVAMFEDGREVPVP